MRDSARTTNPGRGARGWSAHCAQLSAAKYHQTKAGTSPAPVPEQTKRRRARRRGGTAATYHQTRRKADIRARPVLGEWFCGSVLGEWFGGRLSASKGLRRLADFVGHARRADHRLQSGALPLLWVFSLCFPQGIEYKKAVNALRL